MHRDEVKILLKRIKYKSISAGVVGNESPTSLNALGKSVPISWFEQFANFVEDATIEKSAQVAMMVATNGIETSSAIRNLSSKD